MQGDGTLSVYDGLMTVDGFALKDNQAFSLTTRASHSRLRSHDRAPARRTRVLVANHAFGWNVLLPMALIAKRLQRRVWVLGENAWWKVPFVRRFAAALGVVDGTQANANRLLQANELVLVLPGVCAKRSSRASCSIHGRDRAALVWSFAEARGFPASNASSAASMRSPSSSSSVVLNKPCTLGNRFFSSSP